MADRRLVFGMVKPCPHCDLTGYVAMPAMGKAERDQRRRENLRRAAAKLEPLPRPPRKSTCPHCNGRGVMPNRPENADPVPWEL